MRWERQRWDRRNGQEAAELPLDLPAAPSPAKTGAKAGLRLPEPVPIEAGTSEALAIEIRAKSLLNRVPGGSRVPFNWTLNPYRGCGHACRYCFARNTHTYLDLDSGQDFDSKIVVKVNAATLLRRELANGRCNGEPIAMGTNTDPYQRAEGRYRLMPEIVDALTEYANPFSILTKGTLILRDIDAIVRAADVTRVSIAVSVGSVDEDVWREVEPGTPAPARRLDVVRQFAEAGVGCSVLMAPILPGLTDSAEQIDRTVGAIAEAGASGVTPLLLHLRTGAREWYFEWLSRRRTDLLPLYERLYSKGAYCPSSYQREVFALAEEAIQRHGLAGKTEGGRGADVDGAEVPTVVETESGQDRQRQLSLL